MLKILVGLGAVMLTFTTFAQQSTATIQKEWLKSINQNGDLTSYFNQQAGILTADELSLVNEQSLESLSTLLTGSERYERAKEVQLRPDRKYEIGTYYSEDNAYKTLIAWRLGDEWKKELEIVYPAQEATVDLDKISMLRQAWGDYASNENPKAIATKLYVDRGYYFNRGRIYSSEDIETPYAYMLSENFEIYLEPNEVVPANAETVYEVGTFHSRGKGLYILVWKRIGADYRLLIDFNF